MSRLEFIGAHAWKNSSTILGDPDLWLSLPNEVDRELMSRLCSLADTAAGAYCGVYPLAWPYAAIYELVELPWFSEWYQVSHNEVTRQDAEDFESSVEVRLKEGHDVRFVQEISGLAKIFDDILIGRGYSFDPLDLLFNEDISMDKRRSIQSLCVLMLCHIDDAIRLLLLRDYQAAMLCMSTVYQCLSHLQIECDPFVSGRAKGGALRHAKDPKAKDKELVYECWQRWHRDPTAYPSLAAFSRDMLDKTQHLAGDPQVIGRWVRAWRGSQSG